jgi:hypothetical protein
MMRVNLPNLVRVPILLAKVRMHLLLNGYLLPIAQLGPDFLILDHGIEHPSATAEIFLKVDAHKKRWTVRLPNGVPAVRSRVPMRTLVAECARLHLT